MLAPPAPGRHDRAPLTRDARRVEPLPCDVALARGDRLAVLAAAAAPAAAATLTVAGEDDPDSLDPALAYAPESWQVLVNAGEGLLGYRRESGAAGPRRSPPSPRPRPPSRTAAAGWSSAYAGTPASARREPPGPPERRQGEPRAPLPGGLSGAGLYRGIRGAPRSSPPARAASRASSRATAPTRWSSASAGRTRPSCACWRCPSHSSCRAGRRPATRAGRGSPAGPYRVASYARGARIVLERNRGYVAGAAGPAEARPSRWSSGPSEEALRRAGAGEVDYVLTRLSPDETAAALRSPAQVRRHLEGRPTTSS